MDRRKSLKLIATGALAGGALAAGCTDDKKTTTVASTEEVKFSIDRNPDEVKNEKRLLAMDKFFTDHEMATITLLTDIIIPKDDVSGSASDAKVPDFIEFIVKDMPQHQTPMKGGLRWLDMHCMKKFGNTSQWMAIIDTDEFIVPKQPKGDLPTFLKALCSIEPYQVVSRSGACIKPKIGIPFTI